MSQSHEKQVDIEDLLAQNATSIEGIIAGIAEYSQMIRARMEKIMELVFAIEAQDKVTFDSGLSALTDEDLKYHWQMSKTPDPESAEDYSLSKVAEECGWDYAISALLGREAEADLP